MSRSVIDQEPGPLTGKVLIVDTDTRTVQQLGAAFKASGFEPLEATTFESAKQIWAAEQPDVLVADIRLGQYNGLQLLLRARGDRPDLAAVITSAVDDRVLELEARRFGAIFLVKPVTPVDVIDAVLRSKKQANMGAELPERRVRERRSRADSSHSPERRYADRRSSPPRLPSH